MTSIADEVGAPFAVPATGYDLLMGRYLPTLAPAFVDVAGVREGMRVLDVGCGPGGLTRELVARVGAGSVAAIDPSPPFVEACRVRNPGVDVRRAVAEGLPFPDGAFDAALSSLVVGFMTDADAGVQEMARVTRPGGVVALCFWDLARMPVIRTFWAAAAAIDPNQHGEPQRRGTRPGELAALLQQAGAIQIEESTLTAQATYQDFEDWWSPFPRGVGPVGVYCQSLPEDRRKALRAACHELLGGPTGSFTLTAHAPGAPEGSSIP